MCKKYYRPKSNKNYIHNNRPKRNSFKFKKKLKSLKLKSIKNRIKIKKLLP